MADKADVSVVLAECDNQGWSPCGLTKSKPDKVCFNTRIHTALVDY